MTLWIYIYCQIFSVIENEKFHDMIINNFSKVMNMLLKSINMIHSQIIYKLNKQKNIIKNN